MPSPGGQFLSDEFGDIEDYFVSDYQLIDQYVGDTLWVWGEGTNGALGTNAAVTRSTPVTTFAGGTNWKNVSINAGYTAAIKTDGTLWTWGGNGSNNYGQNGINADTTAGRRSTPLTTFAGGNNWKQVCSGYHWVCSIKTDGTLWCWGRNQYGQLGINTASATNRLTPITTFAGGTNWKKVSCGGQHTAAIKTDGTLWTWGRNTDGQLGINVSAETTGRTTPVTTFAGGNNWKDVSAGSQHTLAIKTDGTLWVWGRNFYGELGSNDSVFKSTPVTTFAGGTNWKSIPGSLGEFNAAIKTDGTLWTWGRNAYGNLGINNTTQTSTPVTTFAGGTNWKSLSTSADKEIAAIKTDGTLWTWGRNNVGQLGINATGGRTTPVTIFAGGNNWKTISITTTTAAIKAGLNVDFS